MPGGNTDPITGSLVLRTSFRGVKVLDKSGAGRECCQGGKAAVVCGGQERSELS